jgi:pectinesterase
VVDKPHITLVGTSVNSTIVTWNETWVAAESPTVSVLASDLIAKRLTFQVKSVSSVISSPCINPVHS